MGRGRTLFIYKRIRATFSTFANVQKPSVVLYYFKLSDELSITAFEKGICVALEESSSRSKSRRSVRDDVSSEGKEATRMRGKKRATRLPSRSRKNASRRNSRNSLFPASQIISSRALLHPATSFELFRSAKNLIYFLLDVFFVPMNRSIFSSVNSAPSSV